MASFDILQACSFGHRFVWREREYLTRLAVLPVFIKFICHLTVIMLGWDEQFMRQGLVMLPSYLADGWMLSHMVRLFFLGQRWPFRASGNLEADMAALQERARGIMTGALSYALAKLIVAGGADVVFQVNRMAQEAPSTPPSTLGAMAGILVLVGAVWLFRFFWFFIPAALDYPLQRYARDIKGFSTSLYMLGLWVGCVFPLLVMFGLVLVIILAPYEAGQRPPVMIECLAAFIRVVADTLTATVATAAACYALHAMIGGQKQGMRGR